LDIVGGIVRGDQEYTEDTYAHLYATPTNGADFLYWTYDGTPCDYNQEIYCYIPTDDHSLQAVFTTTQQDYYVASIDTENSVADCPEGVIGNVNDGVFAGLTSTDNSVIYCTQ
jgi:hypothetical protein